MKDDLILERYTDTVIQAERLRARVQDLEDLPVTISAKGMGRMATNVRTLLTSLPLEGDMKISYLRQFLEDILKGVD